MGMSVGLNAKNIFENLNNAKTITAVCTKKHEIQCFVNIFFYNLPKVSFAYCYFIKKYV